MAVRWRRDLFRQWKRGRTLRRHGASPSRAPALSSSSTLTLNRAPPDPCRSGCDEIMGDDALQPETGKGVARDQNGLPDRNLRLDAVQFSLFAPGGSRGIALFPGRNQSMKKRVGPVDIEVSNSFSACLSLSPFVEGFRERLGASPKVGPGNERRQSGTAMLTMLNPAGYGMKTSHLLAHRIESSGDNVFLPTKSRLVSSLG